MEEVFGEWIVVADAGRIGPNRAALCRCSCGSERRVLVKNLRNGRSRSCGHTIDLSGQRFGMWTVVSEAGRRGTQRYFLCRCDCGTSAEVSLGHLRGGNSTTCGCSRQRHGMTGTPTYRSWSAMLSRVRNSNHDAYERYGGRGVSVCDRWHEFENFLEDMGVRQPGTTLDRIDANGDYEPANCRWATYEQQGQNQRSTKLSPVAACLIRHMKRRGSHREDIARAFDITRENVNGVCNYSTWRNALDELIAGNE